jgi:hypothetical protein
VEFSVGYMDPVDPPEVGSDNADMEGDQGEEGDAVQPPGTPIVSVGFRLATYKQGSVLFSFAGWAQFRV